MNSRISIAGRVHAYNMVCSGYLVERGRVLLVHHNGFKKWVPPGGHLEPGETFPGAAEREFLEETGIAVDVISAAPVIHQPDSNAIPVAAPFYVDEEREGFAVPTIVQFYYVRRKLGSNCDPVPELSEVNDARFFDSDGIRTAGTFSQVKSLALYALEHHPDARR